MNKCKHCNFSCYPPKPNFIVKKLDGTQIYVNSTMYCSKDCFTMRNLLNNNYDCLFEESPSLGKNTKERNIDFCLNLKEK